MRARESFLEKVERFFAGDSRLNDEKMEHVLSNLKKLKGRSVGELRMRAAQALAACAERHGFSAQARIPDDIAFFNLLDQKRLGSVSPSAEGLLEHFRTRTSPGFFAGFASRERTMAELRARFGPRVEEAAIARAEKINGGRFDLLGLCDLSFGEPVDWHLEPVAGKRAPLVHWSRIKFLDANVAGDKKFTWELNRHQHFLILGRAYWYTRDERFADTFIAHLNSWMDANPPKLGINWTSSLEVAFRAISWLWAFYFFQDSPRLTPRVFLRAMKFLYLHARHLETYLSTYFSPNTHLTGEALGLFYMGTLWPEFRAASAWRERGRNILLTALEGHILPDGVYFERSSYYQRYVTDFYAHLYILARINGERVEGQLEKRLEASLDHLMCLTSPDGTTPSLGDDDGGRLLMLDERQAKDFRATLSTGAALLGHPRYKFVARELAEETLWLLGPQGARSFDELDHLPPAYDSRAFIDGGYFVMRDGWSGAANYLVLDCGPHGAARLNYGHAHADALAFELAACGRTLLVDPGTYTYTGSAPMRDLFRSSAAHNTLTIDGESASVPDHEPFRWRHVAEATLHNWSSHERFDSFAGTHEGYARLPEPATHLRRVLFLKGDYWIVRDRVMTKGSHRYELRFHFSPDARPLVEDAGGAMSVRERPEDAPGLEIFTMEREGAWRQEEGWVSRCYGERTPAPVYTFTVRASGEQEFHTFLIPRRAGAPKACVAQLMATGGRAYEMRGGVESSDFVLLGEGRRIETERIVSDFTWAWLRFNAGGDVLRELVLLGGRSLFVDGLEIVNAPERVGYVVARRLDDRLVLEIDGRISDFRLPLGDLKVVG